MANENNNLEFNTKPLSPESSDSVEGVVAENNSPAQELVEKPVEAQNQQEEQASVQEQEEKKVPEENKIGDGYQLLADNMLVESDETTRRLLILRDKMRNGEIPSNQP